jgi:hypothetical protein
MRPALVLLAMLAGACDAAADASYRGEPLAIVAGVVTSERTDLDAPAPLALIWVNYLSPGTGVAVPARELMSVEGGFPATYRMPIYEPPPDEMLMDLSGGDEPDSAGVAVGYLVVFEPGTTDFNDYQRIAGQALAHAIVYVRGEMQPDSLDAAMFQGVLEPGYHLVRLAEPGVVVMPKPCPFGHPLGCPFGRAEPWSTTVPVSIPADGLLLPISDIVEGGGG